MTSFDSISYLVPRGNQKSFYGKAVTVTASEDGKANTYLISYDTVAAMADSEGRVYINPCLSENPKISSMTTLKHIKSFLEANEGIDGEHWQSMTEEAMQFMPKVKGSGKSRLSFRQTVLNASAWMENERRGSFFKRLTEMEQAQEVYSRTKGA
jgi:hypothetical protein